MMNVALSLAENGFIPDPLMRHGIRRLCRVRLDEEQSRGQFGRGSFLNELRQSPLAVHQQAANDQHYELPPEFFGLVLGAHRKYSGCEWPAGVNTLDQAEAEALQTICERAELHDGLEVLDLGCGWGSLSLWIAERYPESRIMAVSNSAPQGEYIRQQCRERGLLNLTVLTADVAQFEPGKKFDRVISIEMFEHMRNYQLLLRRVSSWLKDDGRLFVHVFCHKHFSYFFETDGAANWMGRHFFTGGLMPSADLFRNFEDALVIHREWQVNGTNYKKTADAWLENFDNNSVGIAAIFDRVYGSEVRARWMQRWRIFFLSCSELFGFAGGEEWFVSHFLFKKRVLQ